MEAPQTSREGLQLLSRTLKDTQEVLGVNGELGGESQFSH